MLDRSIRCDHCGAEAWVSVKKIETQFQLDFCAHAYQKNSILLHAQGWEITQDERDLINVKPSVSASNMEG